MEVMDTAAVIPQNAAFVTSMVACRALAAMLFGWIIDLPDRHEPRMMRTLMVTSLLCSIVFALSGSSWIASRVAASLPAILGFVALMFVVLHKEPTYDRFIGLKAATIMLAGAVGCITGSGFYEGGLFASLFAYVMGSLGDANAEPIPTADLNAGDQPPCLTPPPADNTRAGITAS